MMMGRRRNKKGQDRAELQEVRADKVKLLEQLEVLTEKEQELSANNKTTFMLASIRRGAPMRQRVHLRLLRTAARSLSFG